MGVSACPQRYLGSQIIPTIILYHHHHCHSVSFQPSSCIIIITVILCQYNHHSVSFQPNTHPYDSLITLICRLRRKNTSLRQSNYFQELNLHLFSRLCHMHSRNHGQCELFIFWAGLGYRRLSTLGLGGSIGKVPVRRRQSTIDHHHAVVWTQEKNT